MGSGPRCSGFCQDRLRRSVDRRHSDRLVFATWQAQRAAADQCLYPVARIALRLGLGQRRARAAHAFRPVGYLDHRQGCRRGAGNRGPVAGTAYPRRALSRKVMSDANTVDAPDRGRTAAATSMSRYSFRESEAKWQRVWQERDCFTAREDPSRPKYYVLEMFP